MKGLDLVAIGSMHTPGYGFSKALADPILLLYKDGLVSSVTPSCVGQGEKIREYLVSNGVPEAAIRNVDYATSTLENVAHNAGLENPAWICYDFHAKRMRYCCKRVTGRDDSRIIEVPTSLRTGARRCPEEALLTLLLKISFLGIPDKQKELMQAKYKPIETSLEKAKRAASLQPSRLV